MILNGYITHIIYKNAENAYCVFVLHTGDKLPDEVADELEERDLITCTGTLPGIGDGDSLSVTGEFLRHPSYGMQFAVDTFEVIPPDGKTETYRYLASGAIKGIGQSLAKRITERFGDDTLRIMEEEPERLAELKGISERMARNISAQMVEKREIRSAVLFLAPLGISGTLALRIYEQYGTDLYDVIDTNPYRIAEEVRGVGFKTADEIARRRGVSVDSEFRVRSGILYALAISTAEGHTYLPREVLVSRTHIMLGVDEDYIEANLMNLVADRKVAIRGEAIYLRRYYNCEERVASRLIGLDREFDCPESVLRADISAVCEDEDIELDEMQFEAVAAAATHGISVITGGPGTGKTTTIRTIIRYFEKEKKEIFLAAPTGRAAKRMSEATGRDARTIHRMLEVSVRSDEGNDGGFDSNGDGASYSYFDRNEKNPLTADVIIIDEMSMMDIIIMDALLRAVSDGTRLILVGDVDQLPSVGPGQVLKDIINSGRFSVVCLEKIFRQAQAGDIVQNAHKIQRGEELVIDNKSRDFFLMPRYDADAIIDVLTALVAEKLPKYVNAKPFDIQVLTPTRKGLLGVDRLNQRLQEVLNPPAYGKNEREFGGRILREGDKVMQVRNNYQIEWEIRGKYDIAVETGNGIFNGDMGIVREIDEASGSMWIEYEEGRMAEYPFKAADELELAYAVTIHKSQGSEYPAVVIPLLAGPPQLMNRNLIYTAITRARDCVVLVGNERVLSSMIHNTSQRERYSGLEGMFDR